MDTDLHVQALGHLHSHRPAQAQEVLRSALALNPLDGAAHLLMAQATAQTGDLVAAEQHARAATADQATRADGFSALARIIGLDEARAAEALEAATAAVGLEPQEWTYRCTLAIALVDVRDFASARAQADTAVRLAPADPAERSRALVTLARVLLADPAGRQQGYQVMREAAALDPTDPGLQQQVMIAQFTSGRRAEAVGTALATLRVTPTGSIAPLIARLSIYLLLRRVLGWMLLSAFLVPLVFFGILGSAGEPPLLTEAPDLVVRAGSAVGLALFALIGAVVLRPLRDRSIARAVWRFARRSALFWTAAVLVGLAVLCYLGGLVLGGLFFPAVPLPLFALLLAWIVHGQGARSLKAPDAASVLVAESR